MPNQVLGYYNERREKLLRDLQHTWELMSPSVVARYGNEFAGTLRNGLLGEYEKLVPDIPYIKGFRARALNTFLLVTAQELAVYKAMKAHGKPPGEAWELCHEALRLRLAEVPRWKRRLLERLMFSRVAKKIFRETGASAAKNAVRGLRGGISYW